MHTVKSLKTVLFNSTLLVLSAFLLAACAQTASDISLGKQTPGSTPVSVAEISQSNPTLPVTKTQTVALSTSPAAFTDPFAYCTAIGTVDAPDQRYNGPKMPEPVAKGLQKASGASPDAPLDLFVSNSYWRCLDGKVYACFVGANLPCTEKANIDKTPTSAETDFCKANQNSDLIPAAVTGHDTVYMWGCKNGAPLVLKQEFQVDSRGFISNFWYPITGQ